MVKAKKKNKNKKEAKERKKGGRIPSWGQGQVCRHLLIRFSD